MGPGTAVQEGQAAAIGRNQAKMEGTKEWMKTNYVCVTAVYSCKSVDSNERTAGADCRKQVRLRNALSAHETILLHGSCSLACWLLFVLLHIKKMEKKMSSKIPRNRATNIFSL
jgi:hypothetical protein